MRLSTLAILTFNLVAAVSSYALSGRIVDDTGAGKAGVVVSLHGATATSNSNGEWTISASTGIPSHSKAHQATAGNHIISMDGHLILSFSGYDLMGRPLSRSVTSSAAPVQTSKIAARTTSSGLDTFTYSWNGSVFLRDTTSDPTRSGIIASFDKTAGGFVYGWLLDARDGKIYRTMKIAGRTWMEQNLSYAVDSSWCPDYNSRGCPQAREGRLYQWASAMALGPTYNQTAWNGTLPHRGVCPEGWHLPSDAEWSSLARSVGNTDSTRVLLAKIGYTLQGAGWRGTDGAMLSCGIYNVLWTSSENGKASAQSWVGNTLAGIWFCRSENAGDKSEALSVRCVSDIFDPSDTFTTLHSLSMDTGTLSPAFDSSVTSYRASVPILLNKLVLTLTSSSPDDTIKVNGVHVTSGMADTLSVAHDTTIRIVVSNPSTSGTHFYQVAVVHTLDTGIFQDARDGQTYKYTRIGPQTWMAQNLNYKADSSWCYAGHEDNCAKYGRLYDWMGAMGLADSCSSRVCSTQVTRPWRGVCPAGWHIPSSNEWITLITNVGQDSARAKLSSNTGWTGTGNGTDRYGFAALPAGWRYGKNGLFYSSGNYERFHSSSEMTGMASSDEWVPDFGPTYPKLYYGNFGKLNGISLRCLKDE